MVKNFSGHILDFYAHCKKKHFIVWCYSRFFCYCSSKVIQEYVLFIFMYFIVKI